jgi:hypothetical protein
MFKDKEARRAIDFLRQRLGYSNSYFNRLDESGYKEDFKLESLPNNVAIICKNLDIKLNLILNHLNLEYISETEKKEPAKLVVKTLTHNAPLEPLDGLLLCDVSDSYRVPTPKPKRKNTKKKSKK